MTRTCKECLGIYSDDFFYSNLASRSLPKYKKLTCIGCQQTKRDTNKIANRELAKADRVIRSEGEKYIKKGLVSSIDEFKKFYRWKREKIAHDIKFQYKNGCPYCHKKFANMGHGLADITLDIVDPQSLPYYGTNTKWVCMTCNRQKQDMPPDRWGRRLRDWELWEEQQEIKPIQLSLFEGDK